MTRKKADLLIASIFMAWGISYTLMKIGLGGIPPFMLISLRFSVAFFVMSAIFGKRVFRVDRATIAYSAVLGLILFGVFAALTCGLGKTTASTAGFLSSTTIIFVPVLQAFITGKMPRPAIVAGVLIAVTGVGLLTVGDAGAIDFSAGSLPIVLAALLYAVHILVTGVFSRRVDGLALGVWQLGFTAFLAGISTTLFETPTLPGTALEWTAVLGLAFICTAYGFVVQPVAQRYTTTERTGTLYALEPVFSAFFGFIFLGEILEPAGYIGAALVFSSVLISGMGDRRNRQTSRRETILEHSPRAECDSLTG